MKFDSNAAWKQAVAAVTATRELAAALAGVFFLLPSLAFALFLPQPEPAPGINQEQLLTLMQGYYARVWPAFLAMAVVQGIGTLAVLTLFTDRRRPTVGEAIRKGLGGILPLIASQLLLGVGFGIAGGLLLALSAAAGIAALTALVVVAVLLVAIYVYIKTSLVSPVIAVEDVRNPVAALRRSWDLTRGNSLRLGLFYLLVAIAMFIVLSLVMALVGIVLAVAGGPETARIGSAVVSSALGAIAALYFAAILAAAHRQLAGPSPSVLNATFE